MHTQNTSYQPITILSHRFVRRFAPERLSPPQHFMPPKPDPRPLFIEIGAGKGKHALNFAEANPNARLIAIERTRNKFDALTKALEGHRSDGHKLDNLTAVHADAISYVVHALPPSSVAGCFILYPNPEPHNKNQRFCRMPFFEFLLSRLQVGANITIASNVTSYLDEATACLTDIWQLPFVRHQVATHSTRTHFEIKYLARGEPCEELIITKPTGYRTRFDTWNATCQA